MSTFVDFYCAAVTRSGDQPAKKAVQAQWTVEWFREVPKPLVDLELAGWQHDSFGRLEWNSGINVGSY